MNIDDQLRIIDETLRSARDIVRYAKRLNPENQKHDLLNDKIRNLQKIVKNELDLLEIRETILQGTIRKDAEKAAEEQQKRDKEQEEREQRNREAE